MCVYVCTCWLEFVCDLMFGCACSSLCDCVFMCTRVGSSVSPHVSVCGNIFESLNMCELLALSVCYAFI